MVYFLLSLSLWVDKFVFLLIRFCHPKEKKINFIFNENTSLYILFDWQYFRLTGCVLCFFLVFCFFLLPSKICMQSSCVHKLKQNITSWSIYRAISFKQNIDGGDRKAKRKVMPQRAQRPQKRASRASLSFPCNNQLSLHFLASVHSFSN